MPYRQTAEPGGNYGSPLSPLNPAAPGIKLETAQFISFTNCYTDANAGNGVEIVGTSASQLNNLYFTGCIFNRDGAGDQATPLDAFAGVKVKGGAPTGSAGANLMKFSNCLVVTGKADDAGGGLAGPKYGVWFENTEYFQWAGGRTEGVTADYYVGAGGNYRPSIVDVQDGIFTLPLRVPVAAAGDGMAYFDQATNKLMIRSGSTWKGVTLT